MDNKKFWEILEGIYAIKVGEDLRVEKLWKNRVSDIFLKLLQTLVFLTFIFFKSYLIKCYYVRIF